MTLVSGGLEDFLIHSILLFGSSFAGSYFCDLTLCVVYIYSVCLQMAIEGMSFY